MIQSDLRAFLAEVEKGGELKTVTGAHWDKEMGAVTEVLYREKVDKAPALLFDDIPGYPKGFRRLYGMMGSPLRLSLTLGLDAGVSANRIDMLNAVRKKMKSFEPVAPREVNDGPVYENVMEGDDVDLLKLPVPIHHEHDGGRYIGTACGVITRDPDTGRVNVGTYRVQVRSKNSCTSYISNGKQGRIHRDKYLAAGKPCPMVIVVGIDPVTEPIPVRTVVHYMMGGIHTDVHGATSLPGLFAAGECACVSVNGANRLGSNSLTEILVFGVRAAVSAVNHTDESSPPSTALLEASARSEDARIASTLLRASSGGETVSGLRSELQETLEEGAGIYRDEASLQRTCSTIADLKERYGTLSLADTSRTDRKSVV